jgi:cytochrome c oxidase assembly protein subunit 15
LLRNLTENIAAVQFDHRLLATLTAVLVCGLAAAGLAGRYLPRALAACLVLAVAAQYSLGVATLIGAVPVPLATAHQAGAVLLLTAVLVALHHLTRTRTAVVAMLADRDAAEHPDPDARVGAPVP